MAESDFIFGLRIISYDSVYSADPPDSTATVIEEIYHEITVQIRLRPKISYHLILK